jgi:hypothetical protein
MSAIPGSNTVSTLKYLDNSTYSIWSCTEAPRLKSSEVLPSSILSMRLLCWVRKFDLLNSERNTLDNPQSFAVKLCIRFDQYTVEFRPSHNIESWSPCWYPCEGKNLCCAVSARTLERVRSRFDQPLINSELSSVFGRVLSEILDMKFTPCMKFQDGIWRFQLAPSNRNEGKTDLVHNVFEVG